jgi:hypothetical protein
MQRDLASLRGHIFNKYQDFSFYYKAVDIHVQNMKDKLYHILERDGSQNVANRYVALLTKLETLVHRGYYYLTNKVFPQIERMNLSELIQVENYTLHILLQTTEKINQIIDELYPYDVNFGDFMDLDDQVLMGIDEVREDLGILPE